MHVTDVDIEYLDIDLRDKLEENSKKRKMTSMDELAATKEALKKVTEEMTQIRKEMNEMRKDQGASGAGAPEDFALGFVVNDFMTMSPTKSRQWVSSTLVQDLIKKWLFVETNSRDLVSCWDQSPQMCGPAQGTIVETAMQNGMCMRGPPRTTLHINSRIFACMDAPCAMRPSGSLRTTQ